MDVPVGLLSGGIDSSIIALIKKYSVLDLYHKNDNKSYDESEYANIARKQK